MTEKIIGGVHPPDGKASTSAAGIKDAPLLEKYFVVEHQNIGAPPVSRVSQGDHVKKGQLLAAPGGFVSAALHSPTSGHVAGFVERPGFNGVKVRAVEIVSDGKDEPCADLPPIPNWRDASPETLRDRVRDAGIVGMGGAAFPTHVKLTPPQNVRLDTLIINGAECEPFLNADNRLMTESAAGVAEGAAILGRILGVNNIIIGIEGNKPEAVAAMSAAAAEFGCRVERLRILYPQGAEKQLIFSLTGRKVPTGGLPMNAGCVVQNAATAFAAREAVALGAPLVERVATITGAAVANPGNWRLRIGTPVRKALELAGGVTHAPAKVILGGPMMGFAQRTLDATVCKNTSGILLLDEDQTGQFTSDPCIRCGRCVDACPMRLHPGSISVLAENERYDLAERHYVMNCIECGCCAYVCPARRPLVQHFRRSKSEIIRRKKRS